MKKNVKNILMYDKNLYTPEAVASGALSESDYRKEYSRLRKIANERLKRLSESEYRSSQAYQINKHGFPKLGDLTDGAFKFELYRLQKFVSARSSSVTGQREIEKTTISSLRSSGYTFINKSNYRKFIDYIEQIRAKNNGRLYDSDRVVDVFALSERKGFTIDDIVENYDFFAEHYEEIADMPKRRNPKNRNSEWYRKLLEEDEFWTNSD